MFTTGQVLDIIDRLEKKVEDRLTKMDRPDYILVAEYDGYKEALDDFFKELEKAL